jgi:uncharacterized membrane protein
MTYSPFMLLHIIGGIVGVVSGSAALLARKGSHFHRAAGKVFVYSMLGMAAGGATMALMKWQRFNILAGLLTIYLVATAWVTVRRREGETGRLDYVLLALALGTMALGMTFGWQAANAATGAKHGNPPAAYVVFVTLALLFSLSDVRMLWRGGNFGAQRIARHLWRMGLALFVAAGSFFLGTAGDPVLRRTGLRATLFTKEIRATHLPQLPVLLIVVLTLYWLIRVRFGNEYKKGGRAGKRVVADRTSTRQVAVGVTHSLPASTAD